MPLPACNVLLIGPPGSGKGTQAIRMAEHYGVPHISTGDLLRAAVKSKSPLGSRVAATLAAGGLVDDSLMMDLVRERLAGADAARGFILDGFPRTVAQAEGLEQLLGDMWLIVILIDVDDAVIAARLGSRRVCGSCTITQSVRENQEPPDDPCSYCGGRLVRRPDDEPDVVRRRLATYRSSSEPLIARYSGGSAFGAVSAAASPNEVTDALFAHVDRCRGGEP